MATVVVFVDAAMPESVVVVVEVVCQAAVLAGVGVFCEASASCITNAAHKFAIAF